MIVIEPAYASQHPRILAVWETSVRATHTFLQESDIATLRSLLLSTYLPELQVFVAREDQGAIIGFLAVGGDRIEMLFIDAQARGKGVGKQLLRYAIDELNANKLDVNEQNPQAICFYQHSGFVQTGRSEVDGQGNPFPLLHMIYLPRRECANQ